MGLSTKWTHLITTASLWTFMQGVKDCSHHLADTSAGISLLLGWGFMVGTAGCRWYRSHGWNTAHFWVLARRVACECRECGGWDARLSWGQIAVMIWHLLVFAYWISLASSSLILLRGYWVLSWWLSLCLEDRSISITNHRSPHFKRFRFWYKSPALDFDCHSVLLW